MSGTEYVTVALGLPIDATGGETPPELTVLADVAAGIAADAPDKEWDEIGANAALVETVWAVHRAGDVPPVLVIQMDDSVEELLSAVEDEDPAETCQAALGVARATLDLQLPYVGTLQADLGALRIWAAQLGHAAAEDDAGAVAGDVATLEAVWDRVDTAVAADAADEIGGTLAELRAAANDEDLAGAAELAGELDALLKDVVQAKQS